MKKIYIITIVSLSLLYCFLVDAMKPMFVCCCHQAHQFPTNALPDSDKLLRQTMALGNELRLFQENAKSEKDKKMISDLITENQKMLEYTGNPISEPIISIDKLLLEKYLDVIVEKISFNSGTLGLLLYNSEIQKIGVSEKGVWFIPVEFQQKLNDLIIEKAQKHEKIQSNYITPPDYANPIIKKTYDASVSGEYVAEENGWVFARAYSNNAWTYFEVNGNNVGSGKGDGLFYGNSHFHGNIFYPVHKEDKYKFTGGSWHTVIFYPCLKIN